MYPVATSYSSCIGAAVIGKAQRGTVLSAFTTAANIVLPDDFLLSLNATASPRMPNGLHLSAAPGDYPFSALRPGMPVLLGAQRLVIDAIDCTLDLSYCPTWNPHIQRPADLDMDIVHSNMEKLATLAEPRRGGTDEGWGCLHRPLSLLAEVKGSSTIRAAPPWEAFPQKKPEPLYGYALALARSLCGRGQGLTPTGDDILAGWMAAGWLLYGPQTDFLAACQQIVAVAKQHTHLLSQCWLRYAAEGNVAEPISTLLTALARPDTEQLEAAALATLAIGATSGYDLIQGILLTQQFEFTITIAL